MENNDLEKTQSSLEFENEDLSIFNQDKKRKQNNQRF